MFIRFIPSATTGIVQTFGRFSRTMSPGLNFYIPIIQKISIVSNRLTEKRYDFEVKTKDNTFAILKVAVQFQIKPENSGTAFFSLDNPDGQIESFVEDILRSEVPKLKLDEVFEAKDQLCEAVATNVSSKMTQFGYDIVRTLVTEIEPDSEVKKQMNEINASERRKVVAKNNADADYIKKIREAEADAERKRLQGVGISNQRLAILNGYKTSISDLSKNLGIKPEQLIDFVLTTQRFDTLEAMAKSSNTKTIFVDSSMENSDSFRSSLIDAAN